MKKIHFMLTAFRDGFQSGYGARVFSQDYMPVAEFAARECGVHHMESGGGAMFQSPFFYARENAFDVMDTFRQKVGPGVELQTLARGISVVALKAQPRDIVKMHADLFKKHGISTIRNFDALNDVSNLIWSGQCIKGAGLKHEVAITMMELPPGCTGAHDVNFYESVLRHILDADVPCDSLCFKDASGTSTPQKVYETFRMARRLIGDEFKIAFHSHDTAGIGTLAYKAAIEGGADQLDLSLAPVSGGTCQPDVLTMWHALRGTEYSLDINVDKFIELEEMLKDAMKEYFVPPEATRIEPLIPFFPMPGGALTANTQMLRDNLLMDKYPQVIAAMGEAVKKGGFGTSVTPVSQFYFQQAFNNVMFGPWNRIAEGYGKMVLGYFGKTPVEPDPQVVSAAAMQLKLPRATDHLETLEKDIKRSVASIRTSLEKEGLPVTEENIFIVASCEDKGVAFLKGQGVLGVRKNKAKSETVEAKPEPAPASVVVPVPTPAPAPAPAAGPKSLQVQLNGQSYQVVLDGKTATVNGVAYAIEVQEATASVPALVTAPAPAVAGPSTTINAPLPGLILRIEKNQGATVKKGECVLVMESMKMETSIVAPCDGTVKSIAVKIGDQIQAGKTVAVIQ
jgi:pyruvate carboxylase subunit B